MTNPFMVNSIDALVRWLKENPPELAFDVGANEGGYTDLLLHHGAKKVVAFEPLPAYAEKVRTRFAGNNRVDVQQIALGEKADMKPSLSVLNCWTIACAETTRLDPVSDFLGQKFDINFDFIDSGKFGVPDFVKLDADGYEPAILRGAERLLKINRPAILLELSYLPQELGYSCDRMVLDLYRYHKYVFVAQSGLFVCRHHREMLGFFPWNTSYDVLAVPEERASLFA
jgi:FkbM family methyltransferase